MNKSRSRQVLLAVLALGCIVQSSACWWTPLRGPNFGPLSAFFRKEGMPEVPRRQASNPKAGAYTSVEDRVRLFSADFQAHVTTPLDPAELVAVIASIARSADKLA